MRIPIDWLNEFVAFPDSDTERIADGLTMAGLEVEEILHQPAPAFLTKVTPNRGDWASVFGTAREAAAVFPELTLSPLPAVGEIGAVGTGGVSVRIDDSANCHRFHAIVIRGVKIGPAPQWMQDRLRAALGDRYRPINNVADITNYVMLETGQPLHAFDLDTIPGGEIVVRQALPGEKLVGLDGSEYELPAGTLCICDNSRAISLAGILGGRDTEITDGTVNVLLETAHFDPFCVRRTAKKTTRTEASYRFERGVDPNRPPVAGFRAARLIEQIAGGTISGVVDSVAKVTPRRRVLARMDKIRSILGVDVDRDEAISGLSRLGIDVTRTAGAFDCGVPSWRPDLTIEEDIAEEVGRIALGYANIPEKLSPPPGALATKTPRATFLERVQNALVIAGFQEVVTHTLVGPDSALAGFNDSDAETLTLRNPMAPEYSRLRTSLLPNAFTIAARSLRDGLRDFAIFEVGPVYKRVDDSVSEPLRVSGVLCGSQVAGLWNVKDESVPADFYAARGAVEFLFSALGIDGATFEPSAHPIGHPYRTAKVVVGDTTLGFVGEVSAKIASARDLPRRACFFDLDGDALKQLAGARRGAAFVALPEFPASVRDLAPVFASDIAFAAIEAAARASAGPFLESFRLVDIFTGDSIGAGNWAPTLRFTFRKPDATLRGEEVDSAISSVKAALTQLGGVLRG